MAESSVDQNAIRSKIQKLLAMAKDARGNENENETAMRMANALMTKYGIDAADLQDSTGQKPRYDWIETSLPVGERCKFTSWNPHWIDGYLEELQRFMQAGILPDLSKRGPRAVK